MDEQIVNCAVGDHMDLVTREISMSHCQVSAIYSFILVRMDLLFSRQYLVQL